MTAKVAITLFINLTSGMFLILFKVESLKYIPFSDILCSLLELV